MSDETDAQLRASLQQKMDSEFRAQAKREGTANLKLKCMLLVIGVIAIGALVLLDQMKAHLNETRRKPYSYASVEKHLSAAASNPAWKGEMEALLAGMKELRPDATFATTDEAFSAINQHTTTEKSRRIDEAGIRQRYAGPLKAVDAELAQLLAANPRSATFDKEFAAHFASRTSLISARAVELQDAQQTATVVRTALKEAWDRSNPSQAKVAYTYFGVKGLDSVASHIVDPDDPLSIIYDVLWYAALIIGVMAFAALVLAPIFRAVPLTGAEDSFGERVRGFLSRAPRALSTGSSLLAAAVGAAAIVGASAALPSSPLQEAKFVPPRLEGPNLPADKAKDPATTTDTTPAGDSQPPSTDVCRASDPVPPNDTLTTIHNDITAIRNAINEFETRMDAHEHPPVKPPPPDDRVITRVIELADKVESTVGGLHQQIEDGDDEIRRHIGQSRTAVETRIAGVETRTKNVETQLAGAGTQIDARAKELDGAIILPHMLGERPSFLSGTLGFDRYEVTPAAVMFLEKLGAPAAVRTAVTNLGSARYSNDDLRLALRAELCTPPSHNCEIYIAWRNTVLRAARAR
jgi:hypothetical protein